MQPKYVSPILASAAMLIATASPTWAGTIMLPSGSVMVPNTSTGATVQVSGTYSDTESVTFRVTGIAYEQNSSGPFTNTGTPQYGTNAAGVLVLAGETPAESLGTAGYDGSAYFGALLISLNGGTPTQIFAPSAANGFGSSGAPTLLTFSGPLSALFGNFGIVTNPQVTFQVADTVYDNNSGGFTVSSGVPEPSTWAMLIVGFVGLGLAGYRRAQARIPDAARLSA